jgi:hypothetical protein
MKAEQLEAADVPLVAKIVEENRRMEPAPGANGAKVVGRAQHRKHHACVAASFVVAAEVPPSLRHGVFSNPGASFQALIRFSNGRQQDDRQADVHGMAIKLLDVPGERFEGDDWQTAQDFVLIDDELFFTGDLARYEAINRIIADRVDNALDETPLRFILTLITGVRLKLLEEGRVLERLQAVADQRPASPLTTNYWSTTPYRLGREAVKYMAVCPAPRQQPVAGADPSYLRAILAAELAVAPASFDFVVHLQTDPLRQPIEDPTVSWSDHGAKTVRLATISIPVQPLPADSRLAEAIVYSPWNCLVAHAPCGRINLARKQVYDSLAESRHDKREAERRAWVNVPTDQRPGAVG